MFSAAALPAHLAVIVLLAVLALRTFAAAEKKRRSGLRWMLAFFGLWLAALGLTAFAARWAYERHYHTPPGIWFVYGPAVASAFAVVLALHWILSKKAALPSPQAAATPRDEPRPTPTPQPQSAPANHTPPPHPPSVFKFACPHCGQRLAVTTAEIGTTANCPNCDTLLEVPAPPPADQRTA